MGWNNPPIPWAEFERRLSGRRTGEQPVERPSSRKRQRYVPQAIPDQPDGEHVPYAELHAHSNFSFLDGASSPEELLEEATRLNLHALGLTDRGRTSFEALQRATRGEIAAMMQTLPPAEQAAVVSAMRRIRRAFEGTAEEPRLRPLGPGDLGWIVHRHGVLYAEEYGLDASFEALAAEIGAGFVKDHEPGREAAWVAEVDGAVVGCGALHVLWEDLAEIRTVATHPDSRGRGIGHAVCHEIIAEAGRLGLTRLFCLTFEVPFFRSLGFEVIEELDLSDEGLAELRSSYDAGVAEFLDLPYVKPNTLGNSRMLLHL